MFDSTKGLKLYISPLDVVLICGKAVTEKCISF